MPLMTLTSDEEKTLRYLLEDLHGICLGDPKMEPVNWKHLLGRIQDMRMLLFEEK